jgi:hypothetical protein
METVLATVAELGIERVSSAIYDPGDLSLLAGPGSGPGGGSAMSAYQSYLASGSYGYDFVVATTQASINDTLKLFLYETLMARQQRSLYFFGGGPADRRGRD